MSGLSAEIGRKIRDAVDFHRGEAEDHSRLADDIDDAWQQRDYEWLRGAGVISEAELREIEQAMVAANRPRKRRTSRRRR